MKINEIRIQTLAKRFELSAWLYLGFILLLLHLIKKLIEFILEIYCQKKIEKGLK